MASRKPHPHHSPSKPLWINISPLSHQVLHSRGAEVGLHSWVPNMRLWCQLWASFNLEDPRFRPHTWEETHSSVSKDRPACWSLAGGLRGGVISGPLCATLACFCPCLSQQGNPQIVFAVENPLSLQTHHVITKHTPSSTCQAPPSNKWPDVLFCLFMTGVSVFFILQFGDPDTFVLEDFSEHTAVLFLLVARWQVPPFVSNWPTALAGPSAGLSSEDRGLVLWVPWAVLFTTTTLGFETEERLWAQITSLFTFSLGDALLWSCAVGFYFQKI